MKHSKTAILLLATCLTAPAFAQDAAPPTAAETVDDGAAIIVTGSRIKQDPAKSALPLQIIVPKKWKLRKSKKRLMIIPYI
jgi:iron complex outermembrane receptor protein